jgi:hypothetical protein
MNDTSPNDALAAEYVLGTLDSEERTQTQALLVIDQELVGKVRLWERRLGELHLMVEPVEPDGKIWERIKAKMPARPEPESKPPEPPPAEAAPAPPPPSAAAPEAPPAVPTQPPPSASPDLGFRLPPAASLPRGSVTAPTPTPASTPASAPAPVLTPRVIPPPSVAPQLATPAPAAPSAETVLPIRRRLTRWRAFAILMTLVVVAVGALIAAWRLVPERVPPVLQPAALMRLIGVTVAGSPPRRPAPPESQFDE